MNAIVRGCQLSSVSSDLKPIRKLEKKGFISPSNPPATRRVRRGALGTPWLTPFQPRDASNHQQFVHLSDMSRL